MSRPGFEPGPLAFRASALPTELSGLRITPPLRLKVEPVAPDLESNVTTDIRPGVIRRPDSSVGRLERWPGTPEARVRIPVVTCCFSLLSWLVIHLLFDV